MYNVEPYVERCLLSLQAQDISKDEYEIICINDGSPDKSREVVLRLQKEFSNIELIDQENQGVSRARNNGIDKANGKYLMFIDPDDYVTKNSLGRIITKAETNSAQVVFLGFTFLKVDESVRSEVLNDGFTKETYLGTEAYHIARGDGGTDPDRMVGVLFKSSFLNDNQLRYLRDVPYLEDGELITRILCLAESCIFDGHTFYQRTTRPGSATNSKLFYSPKARKGFLLAAKNLKKFQQNTELEEHQNLFLNQPIVKFVILAIHSSMGADFLKKIRETIKELRAIDLKKCQVDQGCNRLYKVYGRAYNISPYFLVVLLFIWPRLKELTKRIQKRS
jgi:glycosyltransferase involved in cell wall biosynthesis